MSDEPRPTCCERARTTETLTWWTEDDWRSEGGADTRSGWAIVSGFGYDDRGCKTEPEYARAEFCPFCGVALSGEKSAERLDHPDQLHRYGKMLSIELWYPGVGDNADIIELGLCHVRAADSIRIHYDFERNGYVIQQDAYANHDGWSESKEDWQEVAFVGAWARETDVVEAPP